MSNQTHYRLMTLYLVSLLVLLGTVIHEVTPLYALLSSISAQVIFWFGTSHILSLCNQGNLLTVQFRKRPLDQTLHDLYMALLPTIWLTIILIGGFLASLEIMNPIFGSLGTEQLIGQAVKVSQILNVMLSVWLLSAIHSTK